MNYSRPIIITDNGKDYCVLNSVGLQIKTNQMEIVWKMLSNFSPFHMLEHWYSRSQAVILPHQVLLRLPGRTFLSSLEGRWMCHWEIIMSSQNFSFKLKAMVGYSLTP